MSSQPASNGGKPADWTSSLTYQSRATSRPSVADLRELSWQARERNRKLGLTGMLLAACLHLGDTIVVSKAIVTVVFTFVAMPIGSHLLAKAAHHVGAPMWDRTTGDELAQDKLDPSKAASDSEMGVWKPQSAEQSASDDGDYPPVRAA